MQNEVRVFFTLTRPRVCLSVIRFRAKISYDMKTKKVPWGVSQGWGGRGGWLWGIGGRERGSWRKTAET